MTSALFALPPELFTNVLSCFCDGRTMSTFLLASRASREFDAFETIQGALVERYEELTKLVKDESITDTLRILIDQIRQCERSSPEAMKLFSERCAILDYFEAQLHVLDQLASSSTCSEQARTNHWLIWSGEFESQYGKVRAYITSPYWSISAIASWYRELELSQFSLVRPRVPIVKPESFPFGCIAGRSEMDSELMDRIRVKIDDNYEAEGYWKGMTALQYAYDPTPPLTVTAHSFPLLEQHEDHHVPNWVLPGKSLTCYWDDFETYDDDALDHLGEHIVRLMQRFVPYPNTSFREAWKEAVEQAQQSPLPHYVEDDDDPPPAAI